MAERHKCNFIVLDIWDDLSLSLIKEAKHLGSNLHFFKVDLSSVKETEDTLWEI